MIRRWRGGQRAVSLMVAALIATVLGIAAPQPAQAASLVQGCTQGFCIDVYTGDKNYSNRTQWVERVEVYLGNGSVEAWTQNWYRSANASRASWYVGKWVGTGHGVCGATRKIPCITIRV
jgi:hypothetical protein